MMFSASIYYISVWIQRKYILLLESNVAIWKITRATVLVLAVLFSNRNSSVSFLYPFVQGLNYHKSCFLGAMLLK